MIASSLLLLMEEEDAFWMLSTIVEDILPASYYSSTLLGKSCSYLHFQIYIKAQASWSLGRVLFYVGINCDQYES
jgi:hypothetical protein